MILYFNEIYAEFVGHFLTTIQSAEERNNATLLSGFLRSAAVSDELNNLLCKDSSFLPLSALVSAGCIVDEAVDISGSKASRLALFCDKARIEGALLSLGLVLSNYTQLQQITLVTCIQEATNKVIDGRFRIFANNIATITNPEYQRRIIEIMSKLAVLAFTETEGVEVLDPVVKPREVEGSDVAGDYDKIPEKIFAFRGKTIELTSDALHALQNLQKHYLAQAKVYCIEIPDEELEITPKRVSPLPLAPRIAILEEITALLATDKELLDPLALLEHEAHVQLVKIHCIILSMTYQNLWQVELQWLLPGTVIAYEDTEILIPSSISGILAIIERTTAGNYMRALQEIQAIALSYERDWYTWTRNKIPFFAAAPAVKEFLDAILATNSAPSHPAVAGAGATTTEEPSGVISDLMSYGLSFFSTPITADETATSSPARAAPLRLLFSCLPAFALPSPAATPTAEVVAEKTKMGL